MTQVITHRASAFAGTSGGLVYIKSLAGVPTKVTVTVPTGVGVTSSRPYFLGVKRRIIIAGAWNQVMILTEDNTFHRAGIQAPSVATYDATNNPNGLRMVTAAGASTGGTYIGYVTFLHKIGSTIVAESSYSAGTPALTTTNVQSRAWTGIPTTSPNPRVTHVRGYLSVAGGLPKFAWERSIGLSTLTESVLDGELLEEASFRRGVPPAATLCEYFHDRAWYNHPGFPDRLYFSELNEPESVYSLNFIATREGEAITATKGSKDQLLVCGANSSYVIHGWDESDITMERVSPSVGCIASHSMVNLDETIVFASSRGLMAFDGGIRSLSEEDMALYWTADYNANKALYQDSFGCVDLDTQTYQLLVPKETGFKLVAFYKPMRTDGSQVPWFGTDARIRKDYTMGLVDGQLVTGSSDGYARTENTASDDGDDSDAGKKTLIISTRHEFGEDEGGEEHLGKKWIGVDLYGRCENGTGTLYFYPGEESAIGIGALSIPYSATIPTGVVTGYVSQNRWHFRPPNVAGQGLTLYMTWDNAKAVTFRGYGMEWEEGPQARLPTT